MKVQLVVSSRDLKNLKKIFLIDAHYKTLVRIFCLPKKWKYFLNFTQGVQVRGSKRLGCYADPYTVSRCRTRGESEDHTSEKARKGSTLALKPRTDVQNRDTSGPTKRTYVLPKFKKKTHQRLCNSAPTVM